jgi:secreted PhoX family phosphatase
MVVHGPTGNLFVCEDGDDMELVLLTPDGHADPFAQFVGHDGSEVTGAAFDPSGTRLVVNSQRAPTDATFDGRTYMITGPF